MSVQYRAVQWNHHKKIYDLIVVGGVILFVTVFVGVGLWMGSVHPVTLLMRGTSSCALTMLSIILMIGPAARLDRRFSPLLYNRRHFGVTMFLVALTHGLIALWWYHGSGVVSPIVSVFTTSARYDSLGGFPFQPLGVGALVILFLMAATSHDFWLKNLSPGWWKTLHTLVYVAYGLIVMHVTLGFLQDDVAAVYAILLGASVCMVVALHVLAAVREWRKDSTDGEAAGQDGWFDVGSVDEIQMNRAKIVALPGRERIAVFRHAAGVSAISNVCAHQNGPLGEGRIVDGCVTCPWHGYQYFAHNGQSPPPFNEKLPTFDVRLKGRRILLNPDAHPPGTEIPPASVGDGGNGGAP